MELLKEYVLKSGKSIDSKILKVDSFLNHQIDPKLMMEIGDEFKKRFEGLGINKILTIESSGIAIGLATAYIMDLPLVFAKKKIPSTMEEFYMTKVVSFTKKKEYSVCIGKEFLNKDDKILIVDDFLAMGNAVLGLNELVKQSGGEILGVGIAITKGFQDGEKILKSKGLRVESLVTIEKLDENKIVFR